MDGSRLSPYPHLSWFAYDLAVHPPRVFILHEYTAVAHRLLVSENGDADFLWTRGATEVASSATGGSLGFFPNDFSRQSIGITAAGGYLGHLLLLPSTHLASVCEAEGVPQTAQFRPIPAFRDTLLLACAHRLLAGETSGRLAEDIGAEITARRLLMRLAAIAGGCPPDWMQDTSVFVPRVMALIVERVDAHLASRASLEDISTGFGLSPSHFARKFKHSTGLSLNRFMNRRRIGQSLVWLKGSKSLAQLSLDLGFSSQSHFTRLFSSLTGMTPLRFRRMHRRTSD